MANSRNDAVDTLTAHSTRHLIALNPRNFTSLKRTPWAGTALAAGIKRAFADSPSQRIGESWEISCDPDALSSVENFPAVTLSDIIHQYPEECLSGDLIAAGRTHCDILIKLLNADSPLSLQIHPSDSHPGLRANECGKPESWLVLAAAPGSGLYLGFDRAMTLESVRKNLEENTFSADMLRFVPVGPGDFFEIDPHVPHAIGPGVVLLEPQRIIAGKSGKTWRMWDWNKKYNAQGEVDEQSGKPRELHVNESLSILDPETQCGPEYVESLRRAPEETTILPGVTVSVFPANQWYQVITVNLEPWTRVRLRSRCAFACVTVVEGSGISRHPDGSSVNLVKGQSYFAPSASLPLDLVTRNQSLQACFVIPAGQGVITHEGLVFE